MKKNRDKEKSPLPTSDQLPTKDSTEPLPVFLVLAVFILSVSFFAGFSHYLHKILFRSPVNITEKYAWLSGSPELAEGLYIFTQEQLKNSCPEAGSCLGQGTTLEEIPLVSALQFTADQVRFVNLPPAVANIFFQPIPINRANKSILTSLPGIGPALAEKIVQRRTDKGPFRAKDELLRVVGIGPKKYAGLVDKITLD